MAEVQIKSQGCLQLCQLSFGCRQEWSNGDRRGASGRGHTPEPHSPLTVTHRGGSTASLDWEKTGSYRVLNWAHDLPSEERTLILPLFSKLWQERPQIPSPHPQKLPSRWFLDRLLKNKTNKTQLYNSRLLPIHITAKCNSLIYK